MHTPNAYDAALAAFRDFAARSSGIVEQTQLRNDNDGEYVYGKLVLRVKAEEVAHYAARAALLTIQHDGYMTVLAIGDDEVDLSVAVSRAGTLAAEAGVNS